MTELLTSAQMRQIETDAMASGEVTGLDLMERAGAEVIAAIQAKWPDLPEAGHAVLLCGPGNNGGDGYVIARHLHDAGWHVEVYALGTPERLPSDARANADAWQARGPIHPMDRAAQGARPDLLVDALFGIGLSRPLPEDAVEALRRVPKRAGPRTRRCHRVAVDCPSGLDCDTGEIVLPAMPKGLDAEDADPEAFASFWAQAQRWIPHADLTVTFHRAKVGHWLGQGPGICGKLVVADIGLDPWDEAETLSLLPPSPSRVRLTGRNQMHHEVPGRMWPGQHLPALGPGTHKYDRGHVLVLCGGVGRGGAGRLAARAALRVGAGLVTLACPPAALLENAMRLDAVMVRSLRDATALATLLEDQRLGVVCLGPGLGLGAATQDLVAAACAPGDPPQDPSYRRRVVLDADALTSFAEDPEALFRHLHPSCVLTPHEGEFARLFPDLAATPRHKAGISTLAAARQAADRAGCTVLLKGPTTVVASPGGAASLHGAVYDRAAPWLGTAGAGDVLAGLIAGLLAPPMPLDSPHMAAEVGAWLHVEAARKFGPGLIAEDLPETLPAVFRDLGL